MYYSTTINFIILPRTDYLLMYILYSIFESLTGTSPQIYDEFIFDETFIAYCIPYSFPQTVSRIEQQ